MKDEMLVLRNSENYSGYSQCMKCMENVIIFSDIWSLMIV